jgi:hypothetical protein
MTTTKEKTPPFDRLGKTDYEDWPDLVVPMEIAALMRVDPKTVTRWAQSGKIPKDAIVFTVGGHRRFKKQFIYQMFTGQEAPDAGLEK